MNNVKVVGSFIELPSAAPLSACDIVEIRLDAPLHFDEIKQFLTKTEQAKLFVARDPKEGGLNTAFSDSQTRIDTLREALPLADYIDIEKDNWKNMQPIVKEAKEAGCKLIASYHDFSKTPTSKELEALLEDAISTKADILKFAFMLHEEDDIQRCLTLLENNPTLQISIMGMGSLGAKSRVILGKAGSILNYGFLGSKETAPGQISAAELKKQISAS